MSEQLSTAVKFVCFYTKDGASVTGLTVTADVRQPDGTEIVTAAAATEIGDGFYSYTLAGGSTGTEGEYLACFKTAGDVDQAHLPSLWSIGRGGVENLDAAVSSRNATTPPTVAAIRGEMDSNSSKLDVPVSTRLADADYQPPATGGGGSERFVYTSTVSSVPQSGVKVWITSTNDPTFDVVAGTLLSNAQGETTFMLDPGDYFVWELYDGANFNSPEEITV